MNALAATPIADQLRTTCAALRRQPIPPAVLIGLMQDAADALDKANRRAQELAAQVDASDAKAYGAPVDDIAEFQLMVTDANGDEEMYAGCEGQRAQALADILHFYAQCLPTEKPRVFEVVRIPVDLSVMRMGHA